MCIKIFVTATDTGVGKTYTTLKLLEAFSSMGLKAGAFKPIETGVENLPQDGIKLFEKSKEINKEFEKLSLDDIVPYSFTLPAAPYVAKNCTIDIGFLKSKIKKLEKFCDVLLIEGAGGLLVPVEQNIFMIDLIDIFDAKAFLVTPSRLGCINATLLSQNILESRGIEYEWCVNLYEEKETFFETTHPFYKEYFKKFFIFPAHIENIAAALAANKE
ncbi:dethiobiotin synthase [Nitrosophilus alvini]|uniref:dethiobiotin synthase n=1 Tax=Nitrosophilus alvini TaxID=2714855 RepID=UPI001F31B00C|nr:dethiobiotin synthase [Nitrosophilus alvini]